MFAIFASRRLAGRLRGSSRMLHWFPAFRFRASEIFATSRRKAGKLAPFWSPRCCFPILPSFPSRPLPLGIPLYFFFYPLVHPAARSHTPSNTSFSSLRSTSSHSRFLVLGRSNHRGRHSYLESPFFPTRFSLMRGGHFYSFS